MSRIICLLTFTLLGTAFAQNAQARDDLALTGDITSVTLYRGQAQVTRQLTLSGAEAGSQEIVVGNLPSAIIPASLFSESPDGAQVRGVRYRERIVESDPDASIAALETRLDDLERDLARNQSEQQVVREQLGSLEDLVRFSSDRSNSDLNAGTLDPESLERLIIFSFSQRESLAVRRFELEQAALDIRDAINTTQRELAQIRNQNSQEVVREALIFVSKPAGEVRLLLSYLVGNSTWTPAYNVRADTGSNTASIEYNAIIQQLSGEDWQDVALTLSTASPNLSAARPVLGPFPVDLSQQPQDAALNQPADMVRSEALRAPSVGMAADEAEIDAAPAAPSQFGAMITLQQQAQSQLGQATNLQATLDSSFVLNTSANTLELFEATSRPENRVSPTGDDSTDALMLSYNVASPVSLASRRDQQIVRIAESDLDAELYYVATPVLTPLVYREAELTNTSDTAFLAGSVSAYLDGRFVGQSEITTIARGQPFTLGFGADPQLRAERRLENRDEDVQGGNQVIELGYVLELENFSDRAVPVQLYDRLPVSDAGNALRVELLETSEDLSDDALYRRVERPEGLLRWDVSLAANTAAAQAEQVTYRYQLEFDRRFSLTTPTGELLRETFRQFQEERQRR
jgi:hypothetical protein